MAAVPLVAKRRLRQQGAMTGHVVAILRHPVKGFTPERLTAVDLRVGEGLPCDRIFAVENGPSGFDPERPAFVRKQKFAVLAAIAEVARARTCYDETTGILAARAEGMDDFSGRLIDAGGRTAFAAWLTALLGEAANGPLKVLPAPAAHRFFDHPLGEISIVNLASLRELAARIGRPVDPLRFRANLYVDGWPAWAENGWTGRRLSLGPVEAEVFKPIVRCAATHVDPVLARRDMDVTKALFDHFGHMHCGVYVHARTAGRLAVGDACQAPSEGEAA
jgi:uncharacterized protein YcbX